jgi:hypothetical protein
LMYVCVNGQYDLCHIICNSGWIWHSRYISDDCTWNYTTRIGW